MADPLVDRAFNAMHEGLVLTVVDGKPREGMARLLSCITDEASAFALQCGLAASIAVGLQPDAPDGIEVELVITNPDIEADEKDVATYVSAFIAAAGNGDWDGAHQLWRNAGMVVQGRSTAHMWSMVVAIARDVEAADG